MTATTATTTGTAATATVNTAVAVDETRACALFASHLQCSEGATPDAVRDAVTTAVRRYGSRGCVELVAQEFGEHPETAVGRMRWALTRVRQAYGDALPAA